MSLPASPPPAAAVEQPTTAAPTSPQPPAQPESSTTTSWSQEMKNRLERMAKASSNNIELYPGTPAYVAARKLEETIEKTWREYLVELVRNDLAAGITSGRRKHHWQKNECLVVYELVPGAQLEEFPSSDAAKREEYLARTVRDALYIKVPQFSSGFGSPPKSPSATSPSKIPVPVASSAAPAAAKAPASSSLVTPPQSPPLSAANPEPKGAHGSIPPQPHTIPEIPNGDDHPSVASASESSVAASIASHTHADKAVNGAANAAAAPATNPATSDAPSRSPAPSALASALLGVGTAHALGAASPRVSTVPNPTAAPEEPKRGTLPALAMSPAATPDRERPSLGLGLRVDSLDVDDDSVPLSPLPHDDDHEEASIHQAERKTVVASPNFRTLNPSFSLDVEIDRRAGSPIPPELVYYGSGANATEDPEDFEPVYELEEQPVELFKTLNPAISLDAEIARRSPSPVPFVPPVQVQSSPDDYEDDDEPIETFKTLNPAVSLDAEIIRRSRASSPVPQFKELNEELGLEHEIARRSAAPSPAPSAHLELASEEEAPTPTPVPAAASKDNVVAPPSGKSVVRSTFLLPVLLGSGVLRLLNTLNPFAYFLLSMRVRAQARGTNGSSDPKLTVPRPLLRRVLPAFMWRWAGKDADYNLHRVGLGKGLNTVGTRYDKTGSVIGMNKSEGEATKA